MRLPINFALFALLAIAAGTAMAETGLSQERAGLGLKSLDTSISTGDLVLSGTAQQVWQARRFSDYALYGGTREAPPDRGVRS